MYSYINDNDDDDEKNPKNSKKCYYINIKSSLVIIKNAWKYTKLKGKVLEENDFQLDGKYKNYEYFLMENEIVKKS